MSRDDRSGDPEGGRYVRGGEAGREGGGGRSNVAEEPCQGSVNRTGSAKCRLQNKAHSRNVTFAFDHSNFIYSALYNSPS